MGMIREETHYRPVCDRCGRGDMAQEQLEWALDLVPDGWTFVDDVHVCDGCHRADRQAMCGARTQGHTWFTLGDPSIYPIEDRDGRKWWSRNCSDCHRLEIRFEGEDWRPPTFDDP